MCQNTPSLPRSSGGACRSSCIRASALLTPRYWWLRASSLTNPPGRSWKATKFSMMSSRRSLVHMPRITVSSETDALLALGVDLLPLREELPARGDGPDLVSAPFDRMRNPLGVKRCGIVSR